MAKIRHVFTIEHVAEVLCEDLELLETIVANDDNLSYCSIVYVETGEDDPVTALTDDGIEELKLMLSEARSSPQDWREFLDDFVADPQIIARVKTKSLR